MFTSLLPLLLLSTRALAQIPEAFTKGFDPDTIELVVTYPSIGKLQDGEVLPSNTTITVPDFALGDSSAISTSTNYIVVMLDPDTTSDPSTQALHYLRTDFAVEEFTKLSSASASAPVPYAAPEIEGHRYVFLLYVQPDNYEGKLVPSADGDRSFNVSAWRTENGLKPAVAGVHFVASESGGDYGSEGGDDDESDDEDEGEGEGEITTSCSEGASMTATATGTGSVTITSIPTPTSPPSDDDEDEGEEGLITDTIAPPEPTSTSAPTSTSPSTPATTHTVLVGGPGDLLLTYQPPFVNAQPGDLITFDFRERNHTVTQSTFDTPCVANAAGVKSGFRANAEGTPGKEIYEYTVVDSEPKWFFCAQGTHCKSGMVFAVNPGEKWDAFVENAKGEASASSSAVSATSTAAATTSAIRSTSTVPAVTSTSTTLGTVTATGGAPQPTQTGNGTAPGEGLPVFEGAASGAAVVSWVLLGMAGVVAVLV